MIIKEDYEVRLGRLSYPFTKKWLRNSDSRETKMIDLASIDPFSRARWDGRGVKV